MPENYLYAIIGAVSSGAQYVLIKKVVPIFNKGKKTPAYWQLPIPILLLMIGNALMTESKSLIWMFAAYMIVFAVLTGINIFREFRRIDKEAGK